MNWSVIISGGVSILLGIFIMLNNKGQESLIWSLIWSFFFIAVGIAIILYSKEADKIEKIRRVKK